MGIAELRNLVQLQVLAATQNRQAYKGTRKGSGKNLTPGKARRVGGLLKQNGGFEPQQNQASLEKEELIAALADARSKEDDARDHLHRLQEQITLLEAGVDTVVQRLKEQADKYLEIAGHVEKVAQETQEEARFWKDRSSRNVLPKTTLDKLYSPSTILRNSPIVVRAFDGSKREVMGKITLPIHIGPTTFDITFQVMDIRPAYSFLLG
ncbi:hypothetical protein CR513_19785, partial [Mucuna pruriens]